MFIQSFQEPGPRAGSVPRELPPGSTGPPRPADPRGPDNNRGRAQDPRGAASSSSIEDITQDLSPMSRAERIQQLREEHQRRHRERQGVYPVDAREDNYEKQMQAYEQHRAVSEDTKLVMGRHGVRKEKLTRHGHGLTLYFWIKYYAPKVQPDLGSNS